MIHILGQTGKIGASPLALHHNHLSHLNSSSPGHISRNSDRQPVNPDVILDSASILCDMTSLYGHSMMSLNSALETQSVHDDIGENARVCDRTFGY